MIERLLERIYNKPTKDILYEFYIEKDMSIREVAKELTVSVGWVVNACRKYKIYKVNTDKYK